MSSEQDPLGVDEMSKALTEKETKEAALRDFLGWLQEKGNEPLKPDEKPREVEWLCPGFFTRRSSALLAGKAKSGKSALSLDIAIGAATGTGAVRTECGGWLFDFGGKPIRTFYLDTENNRPLVIRRLRSLCEEKGVSFEELLRSGNLICDPLELAKAPPFLSRHEGKPDLQKDIQAAKDFGEMLRKIEAPFAVLDVMSHCYQEDALQRDENAQGFIRDFFKIINGIVSESEACVLLVHHLKKGLGKGAEMGAGSSQMLRTPELLLTLTETDSKLYSLEKQGRQIRDPGEVYLQAGSTKDEGCRVFTQVPEPAKKGRGRPAGEKLEKARELLEAIEQRSGRSELEKPFAPAQWIEWGKSILGKADRKTLQGYREALIEAGDLERSSSGLTKLPGPGPD